MWISRGRTFQEEETVSANALRQECAWHIRRRITKPSWLEQRGLEGAERGSDNRGSIGSFKDVGF